MGRPIIHGLRKHKLYNTWNNMMQRCYNKKCKFYPNYGGRGIYVDEKWHNVTTFIDDMGKLGDRPRGYSIDRINNDGPYTQGNCKWSPLKEQANNKTTVRKYLYKGHTKTLAEWTNELNLNRETIWARLKKGWDFEKAITFPISKSNGGMLRSRINNNA